MILQNLRQPIIVIDSEGGHHSTQTLFIQEATPKQVIVEGILGGDVPTLLQDIIDIEVVEIINLEGKRIYVGDSRFENSATDVTIRRDLVIAEQIV